MALPLQNWLEVIQTANLSAERKLDAVSRWLIVTRAAVFPMTLNAALIGGLLAAGQGPIAWGPFAAAVLGLLLAHAGNNMINDYFDYSGGVDTETYARALYAPHPILAGLVSRRTLRTAILLVTAADLALAAWLTAVRGWPVLVFAGLGGFISLFYVAPPVRLKHIGLGEIGVFAVWGPLMIGGTYYVAAGRLPPWVLVAAVPYGLAVMTVLMGKHLDKYDQDRERGIRTLPVLLGFSAARLLTVALLLGFYALTAGLVVTGILGPWVLLTFLSAGRLVRVLRQFLAPRPAGPPPNYPVWPLWYVTGAFYVNKLAGGLFVAGLALNILLPLR